MRHSAASIIVALFFILPNFAQADGGFLPRDSRNFPASGGVDEDDQDGEVLPFLLDPVTGELLVKSSSTIAAGAATELKQDDTITQLVAILAKILAAPSTEAKQDVMITDLAAILAKIIAAPATETKQDANITQVTAIELNTDSAQTASEPVVISVGSTATLIFASSPTTRTVTMKHMGDALIFLGKSGVTTSTGVPIRGGTVDDDGKGDIAVASHGDDIYGIVLSGTENLRIQVVSD